MEKPFFINQKFTFEEKKKYSKNLHLKKTEAKSKTKRAENQLLKMKRSLEKRKKDRIWFFVQIVSVNC